MAGAAGVTSPVAMNVERGSVRWRLWWAWQGEVASLVARSGAFFASREEWGTWR